MSQRLPVVALVLACTCGLARSTAAAQSRALTLEDGTPVGALRSGVEPRSWRVAPDAPGAYETGLWAAAHRGVLRLQLGAAVDAPPTPSASAVVANELDLETAEGVPFAVLYCSEVDVVREEAATGRVFVRAYAGDGVVLEGVVRERPQHIAWGNCPARSTGEASYPAHWRAADTSAVDRVQLTGTIFWNDGNGCERWRFRRRASYVQLERRSRRAYGGGIVEDWAHYNFHGPIESLEMMALATGSRWIREPRGGHSLGGASAGGFIFSIRFVQADGDGYEWIMTAAHGVRGYHPADSVRWYRSLAACESATSGNPTP